MSTKSIKAFQVVVMERRHGDTINESPVFTNYGKAKDWQFRAGTGENYFTVLCLLDADGHRLFGFVDEKEVY